ncbi:MAG: hypothetical protein QW632_04210 [Ignisphaera sp.]
MRRVRYDGETVWNIPLANAAKISRIFGSAASGIHSNSFGGDFLVVQNADLGAVYELLELVDRKFIAIPMFMAFYTLYITLKTIERVVKETEPRFSLKALYRLSLVTGIMNLARNIPFYGKLLDVIAFTIALVSAIVIFSV